jgi:hypothetical protein
MYAMQSTQSPDPTQRMNLRVAIEYLRDEARRLGLHPVARALEQAIDVLDKTN